MGRETRPTAIGTIALPKPLRFARSIWKTGGTAKYAKYAKQRGFSLERFRVFRVFRG
jgi:hypothetical protein